MENNNLKILSAAIVLSSVILTAGLIQLGKSMERAGSNARTDFITLNVQGNHSTPLRVDVGSVSKVPVKVEVDNK